MKLTTYITERVRKDGYNSIEMDIKSTLGLFVISKFKLANTDLEILQNEDFTEEELERMVALTEKQLNFERSLSMGSSEDIEAVVQQKIRQRHSH